MERRWARVAVLAIVLGAVALAPMACAPAAAPLTPAEAEERTVTVSGSGTVGGEPDEVVVRVGVETMAEEAAAALSQNSRQMQAVIDALTEGGIPEEDIQTQTVQLSPRYRSPEPRPGEDAERELIGYVASNVVEARSEDLDAVGDLLDAAVQAGANRIEGIRFEVSNPTELLSQAREAAWEDAMQKAEQLASLAGVELGDVLSIDESTTVPRPVAIEREMVREAAVPIQPGTENIRVDLRVTWALR